MDNETEKLLSNMISEVEIKAVDNVQKLFYLELSRKPNWTINEIKDAMIEARYKWTKLFKSDK